MTKTCSVAGCKTNHQKKENGITIITNPGTVISFPDELKKLDLRHEWVRFCNQKSMRITSNSGICTKHFDAVFVKEGFRKTLKWDLNPIPTNYRPDVDMPPSLFPTPKTYRKPPSDRSSPDELNDFKKNDAINTIDDITDAVCPPGYKLEVHEGKAAIL